MGDAFWTLIFSLSAWLLFVVVKLCLKVVQKILSMELPEECAQPWGGSAQPWGDSAQPWGDSAWQWQCKQQLTQRFDSRKTCSGLHASQAKTHMAEKKTCI